MVGPVLSLRSRLGSRTHERSDNTGQHTKALDLDILGLPSLTEGAFLGRAKRLVPPGLDVYTTLLYVLTDGSGQQAHEARFASDVRGGEGAAGATCRG